MPHTVIKFITDEDGADFEDDSWHLVNEMASDARRALCNGQAFGSGESEVEYETREVNSNGVTCKNCLLITNWFKNLKITKYKK